MSEFLGAYSNDRRGASVHTLFSWKGLLSLSFSTSASSKMQGQQCKTGHGHVTSESLLFTIIRLFS